MIFVSGASSSSSSAWGSSNRNPPGRSQPNTSTSDGPKARRCGLCRKEGHTRNKCPRKNDFDM